MRSWYASFAGIDASDLAAIREFLAAPDRDACQLMCQLLVPADTDDRQLPGRWKLASARVRDLRTSYGWATKEKRKKLEAIAADPEFLGIIRAAVAHGENPLRDMLGVLALDGTTESIDALLPHLDPALVAKDARLDRLKQLRTYARTPAMQAIVAELRDAVAARSASSGAAALGPVIGIGEVKALQFHVRIESLERASGSAAIQGTIAVDSKKAEWFGVWLTRLIGSGTTKFTADRLATDGFGLGACAAAELPAWLARAAEKLGPLQLRDLKTSLRGDKRDKLLAWLEGR